MFSANIYFWRRYRVNYPFIFGLKQGTELGCREVFFISSAFIGCCHLKFGYEHRPQNTKLQDVTRISPLGPGSCGFFYKFIQHNSLTNPKSLLCSLLKCFMNYNIPDLQVLLLVLFCPFNIIYRSSRFFLIVSAFHCLFAPLYKVKGLKLSHGQINLVTFE